jgi:hypothetical protein
MYCPQCRGEYREGFTVCDDCGVDLVARLTPEDHEAPDYELVFETSETAVVPVIKSALEGAEIPYLVQGEDLMNLFPSEMLGGLFKPGAEVRFLVSSDRADEARELLAVPDDEVVFETSEVDLIPVIKSALDGAEIPYEVPSEMANGLYDPSVAVQFLVTVDRAQEAREVLAAHLAALADVAADGHDD